MSLAKINYILSLLPSFIVLLVKISEREKKDTFLDRDQNFYKKFMQEYFKEIHTAQIEYNGLFDADRSENIMLMHACEQELEESKLDKVDFIKMDIEGTLITTPIMVQKLFYMLLILKERCKC